MNETFIDHSLRCVVRLPSHPRGSGGQTLQCSAATDPAVHHTYVRASFGSIHCFNPLLLRSHARCLTVELCTDGRLSLSHSYSSALYFCAQIYTENVPHIHESLIAL